MLSLHVMPTGHWIESSRLDQLIEAKNMEHKNQNKKIKTIINFTE